jgi:hypothetical protein
MNLSTRPLLTIWQIYTGLLLMAVVIVCYLTYNNVLSYFRWQHGRFYIYNEHYHYPVLTIWNSLFSISYAMAILICMMGLYRRKYWAYILFHILAIPAVFSLAFFVYAAYLNDEPISAIYWLALFLAIGLLGLINRMKKRLFRSGAGYTRKEIFLILGGLSVVAALFYILIIRF